MSAPQPEAQVKRIRTQTITKPQAERKVANISEYLSSNVYRFLLDLGDKANKRRERVITVHDMFLELAKLPQVKSELKSHKLNVLEVEEKILIARKQLRIPLPKDDRIYFSPSVITVILNSFQESLRKITTKITLIDIWHTLLEMPEIHLLVFGSQGQHQRTTKPPTRQDESLSVQAPTVSKLSQNLTLIQKASREKPIINRESEINQILRIITREDKNSCLLVGDSGVGKSSIVQGLAYELLYNQNIPDFLKAYTVLKLDFSALMASAEYPGSNLPQFMEEINNIGKLIIYIDGIRFSSVSQEQYVFNTFLSLLFRNKSVVVILSTDPEFHLAYLEKEQLIKEHFEVIRVNEPKKAVLLEILKVEASRIARKHGVQVDSGLFEPLIKLSKRYLASIPFPQKAISLLEEAAAAARLGKQTTITIENIKNILAEKTGIPLQSISISDRKKLLALEANLNSVVIGQEHAVKAVVEAIKRSRAGIKDQKKPIGSFLFMGPTGVGKTELAKQLALKYYEDEKAFVRLDMSEYSEKHTNQRLIGSPPGYTGYEEGGQFTNPIIRKPYSLILLDEAEKAHPQIFDIFLQVLDEGRLTDSRGRLADFRNAILIFTSNVASDIIFRDLASPASEFTANPKIFYEQRILPELLKVFRPEFINRFDEIIPFKPLGLDALVKIAKLKIKRVQDNLAEKKITLKTSDIELAKLVKAAYDPRFGARPIERMIKVKIETPIAQKIVSSKYKEGDIINWKFE